MHTNLYPDPAQQTRLLTGLVMFFAACDAVLRVEGFGSWARGEADRWSDMDVIVITHDHAPFRAVFDRLCAYKPVFYHDAFTPGVEPCGARVLGIELEGESIFHHLDLNFLTATNYVTPGALDRFGTRQQLYVSNRHHTLDTAPGAAPAGTKRPPDQASANADTGPLVTPTHFTKKAAKRLLRGGTDRDSLRTWSERLRAALHAAPANQDAGLVRLARGYLQVGEAVLDLP